MPVQHVNAQLKCSAEHCNTDSSTLRHVALFTNYFSSFTLARRKELVLSGHDDALWHWSAATLIASCLQKVGKVQAPRGNLLPNAAAWSTLGVLVPGNQTKCKFGVVATCGVVKGLKNLLPNAAAWSTLGVLVPGNQTKCKFGVVATCGVVKGLKNLQTSKSLVFTYNYVQLKK